MENILTHHQEPRSFNASFSHLFHEVGQKIHKLCDELFLAEQNGHKKHALEIIQRHLREEYLQDPLFRRCIDWPRGHPGDFETIELICKGQPLVETTSNYYWLERYMLASPIAQQHRNKIYAQSQFVLDNLLPSQSRILSIGCGGALDLTTIKSSLAENDAQIVLNDIDPDALKLAQIRLASLPTPPIGLCLNALRATGRLINKEQQFDLILAGGLFDYLDDTTSRYLLEKLINQLLSSQGALFITNIAENNPYRPWMEYGLNWKLIERSEEALYNLLPVAARENVVLQRDPTGLAILLTLRKNNTLH